MLRAKIAECHVRTLGYSERDATFFRRISGCFLLPQEGHGLARCGAPSHPALTTDAARSTAVYLPYWQNVALGDCDSSERKPIGPAQEISPDYGQLAKISSWSKKRGWNGTASASNSLSLFGTSNQGKSISCSLISK